MAWVSPETQEVSRCLGCAAPCRPPRSPRQRWCKKPTTQPGRRGHRPVWRGLRPVLLQGAILVAVRSLRSPRPFGMSLLCPFGGGCSGTDRQSGKARCRIASCLEWAMAGAYWWYLFEDFHSGRCGDSHQAMVAEEWAWQIPYRGLRSRNRVSWVPLNLALPYLRRSS